MCVCPFSNPMEFLQPVLHDRGGPPTTGRFGPFGPNIHNVIFLFFLTSMSNVSAIRGLQPFWRLSRSSQAQIVGPRCSGRRMSRIPVLEQVGVIYYTSALPNPDPLSYLSIRVRRSDCFYRSLYSQRAASRSSHKYSETQVPASGLDWRMGEYISNTIASFDPPVFFLRDFLAPLLSSPYLPPPGGHARFHGHP